MLGVPNWRRNDRTAADESPNLVVEEFAGGPIETVFMAFNRRLFSSSTLNYAFQSLFKGHLRIISTVIGVGWLHIRERVLQHDIGLTSL